MIRSSLIAKAPFVEFDMLITISIFAIVFLTTNFPFLNDSKRIFLTHASAGSDFHALAMSKHNHV